MSALFRSILWSHLSPLHCHDFVHVCMCDYAVFDCFDLNYKRVPVMCFAVSRFWLRVRGLPWVLFSHHVNLYVVVVYLFVGLLWARRYSSADIVTSLSGHSLPRLFRFYVSCAQQLLWCAPALVLPLGHTHIAAANLSFCRLRFIICAESALVYFLVEAMPHGKFGRFGRPATVCRHPGWGIRVTPRLHH